ncbi:MAG: PTS sugar transporter subunit IIA [Acidiferrobacterales bacterium]
MTRLLLLTFPHFGKNLINSAAHVLARPLDDIGLVQILPNDKTEDINKQLMAKINEHDNSNGVLILCDIYGATHCNIACQIIEQGKIEMVSGLNLPMLIRAINYINEPVSRLSEIAAKGGTESIKIVTSKNQCDCPK